MTLTTWSVHNSMLNKAIPPFFSVKSKFSTIITNQLIRIHSHILYIDSVPAELEKEERIEL